MKRAAVITSVTTVIALTAGGLTAQATAEAPPEAARAKLAATTKVLKQYDDVTILQLLLAAQGQAAIDHPELKRVLGFDPAKPQTDEAALRSVIDAYLTYDQDFHRRTAKPLQSGNPKQVNAALQSFSLTFNAFIEQEYAPAPSGDFQTAGWFRAGANVLVYVNAVAVAVAGVYTNVGLATLALATIGFVTFYLEGDHGMPTDFERDAFVKTFTDSLG